MLGLWRKELRSLRPFLVLVVLLIAMNVGFELFTDVPHLRPMIETADGYVLASGESVGLWFVVFFALASGLLVREFDDGTLEFLDSLPLSRTRVFVAKVSAAFFVMWLSISLDIGTSVLLHAWSRNSLDPGFHTPFLLTAACLRFCQLVLFLSLGLVLSFLRRFGWLCAGLLLWAYIVTREQRSFIRLLDVIALGQPILEGQRWLIPWKLLSAQLAVASGLMLAAYLTFLGAGDRLLRGLQRLQQSGTGRVFLFAGGAAVVLVGLGVGYSLRERMSRDEDYGQDLKIVYPTWSTARAHTRHYVFLYPSQLSGRVHPLTAEADAVHDQVVSLLGASPQTEIVVDMTESLTQSAGLAYWKKVRMDLLSEEDNPQLLAVLGHETAHVYLELLSDSRLSDEFVSTRFFHEGVASYVEYHLFRGPEDLAKLWSVAAVMRARRQVDFHDLVDANRLQASHDPNLAYPLGEVFVEALVKCYGPASIGQVARAFARKNAPRDLSGPALWQDALQASGFSLENVLAKFFALLDEQVEQQADLIHALPRLRASVRIDDDRVLFDVLGQPPEGWTVTCRFREAEDTPDREYLFGISEEDQTFWTVRDFFPSGSCWYQLGLTDGLDRVIYEPWQRVTLRP